MSLVNASNTLVIQPRPAPFVRIIRKSDQIAAKIFAFCTEVELHALQFTNLKVGSVVHKLNPGGINPIPWLRKITVFKVIKNCESHKQLMNSFELFFRGTWHFEDKSLIMFDLLKNKKEELSQIFESFTYPKANEFILDFIFAQNPRNQEKILAVLFPEMEQMNKSQKEIFFNFMQQTFFESRQKQIFINNYNYNTIQFFSLGSFFRGKPFHQFFRFIFADLIRASFFNVGDEIHYKENLLLHFQTYFGYLVLPSILLPEMMFKTALELIHASETDIKWVTERVGAVDMSSLDSIDIFLRELFKKQKENTIKKTEDAASCCIIT